MQVTDIIVVDVDVFRPIVDMLIAYQGERCLVIPLNLSR